MTQSLRERAQNVGKADTGAMFTAPAEDTSPQALVPFAELSEPTSDDPPMVSVFVAWARVMRDVQAVTKSGKYDAAGTRYNFRGVDAMINAFGPACRRHGVIVVPHEIEPSHALATTAQGKATRETTTIVRWRVYGPDGSHFEGASEGESLDSSDKGAAKAQSVALRAFLIAAGLVPTDEKDPDSSHVERGERPLPKPADYRDEIVDPRTSLPRLNQIKAELVRHDLGLVKVTNEVGDEEALGKLLMRIGREREHGAPQ